MNRIRAIVLLSLCSLLFFSGCRPRGILSSREMRNIIIDLHKTDALLQVAGLQYVDNEARGIYYAQVMEKYGVTQAEFDSSLVWYTAHPQLFDKIYPKVMTQLTNERESFYEKHSAELNLLPDEFNAKDDIVIKPKSLTSAQLDSIFWVNMHGYPNRWNPLSVHDPVDQLFPQVSVLR